MKTTFTSHFLAKIKKDFLWLTLLAVCTYFNENLVFAKAPSANPFESKSTVQTAQEFTTIAWATAASQPYSVSEAQGEVVNGKLYTFGGFDSQKPCCTPTSRAYMYDPVTNKWSAIASMPPMNGTNYGGVTHAGFTTDGKDIYFAGGYTSNTAGTGQIFGTKEVWKYIVSENRYTRLPDLPITISAGQLEYLNGKLYHIAGTNSSRTADLGNQYVLDLNNLTAGWKTLAPLPNPRQHAGSAVYDGKIYFIGGQSGHDDALVAQKDVHRYDPATDTWTKMADLPVPSGATGRGHISNSAVVIGSRILVLGGETVHKTGHTNMVSAYSPATNTWENLTPLPQSRFSGVAGILGGNIYYTGGSSSSTTYEGTPGGSTSSQQSVSSLTLINADTEQDIQTLTTGAVLDFSTLPTKNLNIRANTSPGTVGSVVMELTGAESKTVTESILPYAFYGDDRNGDYYSWTPTVGSYTFKATPYTASQGTGTPGTALTINFTVQDGTSTPPPPPPPSTASKLINSGGGQYTDAQSRTWSADAGATGGIVKTKSFEVAGTTDDDLYLAYRYADAGAPFSYSVPLAAGTYTVRLHFVEPWYGAPGGRDGAAGKRLFHVDMEGQRVLSNYDIFAKYGAATAAVETFTGVSVTDGALSLDFTSITDNAIISAIEILGGNATSESYTLTVNTTGSGSVTSSPNQTSYAAGTEVMLTAAPATGYYFAGWSGDASGSVTPLSLTMDANKTITANFVQTQTPTASKLLNAGGGQYTDAQSRTWSADAGATGGIVKTKSFEVAGTTDDDLYLAYRYADAGAPFSYSVPLAAGTYTVRLHFVEPWYGAPGGRDGAAGKRLFHVDMEGQRVLSNYDIFAKYGAATAAVETFTGVSVTDGALSLDFTSITDNAIISAIEILGGTITDPGTQTLLFTPTSLTANVPSGQQKDLKVNLNNSDEDPVSVQLTATEAGGTNAPSWLLYGGKILSPANGATYALGSSGNEVMFTINATALPVGTYVATVRATAAGYTTAELLITLEVASYEEGLRPYVTAVRPADGQISVPLSQSVSVDVAYPSGRSLDGNTVNTSTVKLYKVSGTQKTEVTGTAVNATAAGDAITLTATLALNTTYEFNISDKVKDGNGYMMVPFTSSFTTAASKEDTPTDLSGVSFTEQILVDNTFGSDGFTTLVIGPDNRLYAATSGGKIERWDIKSDGTLSNHVTISPFGSTRRLLIGLRFDPSATATNLVAWISHSAPEFVDAPDWSGKVSRVDLSSTSNPQVTDYVVNLPRSYKDHATNGIDFGPDGALYFLQGSNTAMGAPDAAWAYRPERLLNACVLRLDIAKARQQSLPINAKTEEGGSYNPYSSSAALTIYASGVRNAYDLVWHSNGQLYVPTNGSAAGGNTPALKSGTVWSNGQTYTGPDIPAMTDVRDTQSDYLFRIIKGGYYGHPNVLRHEYIMNGGNPTSGADPGEVTWTAGGKTYGYPTGTKVEPNYKGWAFDFGLNKSPNGVIEYKNSAFGGKLRGKLLVCRFSGGDDIIVLEPGTSNPDIIRATEGSAVPGLRRPFANPLDVIEDVRNGNLYISEYFDGNGDGQPRITLLRATDSGTPPSTETTAKLINAGGPQYKDTQSRTWAADAGFAGGVTSSKSFDVAGTSDDALYLTYRYASSGAPFSYNVQLSAGTYTIKLHFMEPYFGAPGGGTGSAGRRVFNVDVEGQRVLSNFDIFAQNGAATAVVKTFEGVTVSDGTLNIDFSSIKDNAIVSAIEIVGGTTPTPGEDTTPPVVAVNLSGSLQSPGVYANEVTVAVDASDQGGLASVQYSLNGGAYTTYTSPIRLTQLGDYTVRAKAVDKSNNETITAVTSFKIVKATKNDTYMVLQNPDGFFANDRLSFSLIQIPWRRTDPVTPYNENHNKIHLKISNQGNNTLVISSLSLSNTTNWKIDQLNGSNYSGSALPLSINPGSSADALIEFTAQDLASRVKVVTDTLYIRSNDDKTPYKKVVLHGLWQRKGEGNNEPYAFEIINAFGMKSRTGFQHDDGSINGESIVPNSDEIATSFFVKADNTRPVTVVQMAAYHGCCSATETIRWYDKASKAEKTIVTHDPLYGQSLLPYKQGSTTQVAGGSFSPPTSSSNPDGAFGIRVHKQYTERSRNSEGKIGLRIWKAVDSNGNVIPNAYIIGHDYIGSDVTNYDYQDNLYFISNVKPESGSANYPIFAAVPSAASLGSAVIGSSKTMTVKLINSGGSGDPMVQIQKATISGPNADEFSVTGIAATTLATQNYINATVKFQPKSQGLKNAALLVYFNSAESPLRVPLYGIADNSTSVISAVKRIKGGSDGSVNIAGNTWEADAAYRQGSIKLDKQVVSGPISCTDDDVLYKTYLSASTDLAETRYSIPLPNGNYMVRMHFVENYFSAEAARVFHIIMENQLKLAGFDIFSEVGYRSALVKDFEISVSDGNLNIKFTPTVNRVAIAGLEIYKASSGSQTTALSTLNMLEEGITMDDGRSLRVHPNPSRSGGTFFVELTNFKKDEQVKIAMYDMAGRLITTTSAETDSNGACNKEVLVENPLNRGVYLIRVIAPSGVMTTKLVVN
ncbi:malectin domain-containing carbohydrate-binding protein [Pontibacter sp. MBLB2868]|uniref:malectin domain-containing carbohydrate-binding protein n=1 Tax=Pontibacter sp. MBLB2868 TaxID=3451555 RepID=UPI003F751B25